MRTVTLIPGRDPDLMAAARRVVDASGVQLAWAGGDPHKSLGKTRVALKGSLGPRNHPDNVALRREFDLFASLRRCATFDGVPAEVPFADFLLIRDNARTPSPAGNERIVRFAFEHAAGSARRKVTVLRGDASLLETARAVARDYPQLALEEHSAGTLPPAGELDVALCPGVVADAIWDRCVALTGGPAVSPGVSCGREIALFESDPTAGGDAGPAGMILAGAMVLEHINEGIVADRIVKAVKAALEAKTDPKLFADEVIRRMGRK